MLLALKFLKCYNYIIRDIDYYIKYYIKFSGRRNTGVMENTLDIKQQKTILRVAMISSFLGTFMGSALNLSIPNLEAQFQVSAALIGWVITGYTVAVAAFSVPLGKLADAKGRRRILLAGIGGFSIVSLLCTVSSNIWMLLFFRILQGIFGAMFSATNVAILLSAYPGRERGRVLGLSVSSVYVGLSVGPVVGGYLNHAFNWQSIFIATAIIGFIALFMGIKGIPKHSEVTESGRIDVMGNILFIVSIAVTLYGLTNLSIMKYAWVILLCGIALGVTFFCVEAKAKDPVIRVAMFSEDMAFTFSNLAALLNYGATFAISYLMSIYLQVVMGYPSQTAGLILIAQPIMQALFSPMMGKLSDRIAPYKLASGGMALCAMGLVLFYMVSVDTSLWFILTALVISGFGFAMFSSPNTNAVMSCVQPKDYAVANSILGTMRTVGHSSSMAVVTIVVGIVLGNTPLNGATPEELVKTMKIIFMIFIVLCVIGTFLSMKRSKVK